MGKSLDLPGCPGAPAGPMGPNRPGGPGGPAGPGGPGIATVSEPPKNERQTPLELQNTVFSFGLVLT